MTINTINSDKINYVNKLNFTHDVLLFFCVFNFIIFFISVLFLLTNKYSEFLSLLFISVILFIFNISFHIKQKIKVNEFFSSNINEIKDQLEYFIYNKHEYKEYLLIVYDTLNLKSYSQYDLYFLFKLIKEKQSKEHFNNIESSINLKFKNTLKEV